ncbi:MAG: helix-turn-helix domain-containing protein [Labedaea sp.]
MSTTIPDARSLPIAELVNLRRRVVAAVQAGRSQVQVATLFGVSRQTVGAWVRQYRSHGEGAFQPGRRGRRPGEQLALTPEQQLWVARALVRHAPDDIRLPQLVWTRQAVAELINREFWVPLGVATVGNYLSRWGLPGSQELLRELRERNAAAVAAATLSPREPAWMPGAEVIWIGHSSPQWTFGEQLWPQHPMLQAVSNRGAMYFLSCADPHDAAAVCGFLDRLVGELARRVNVIVSWRPTRNLGELPNLLAANSTRAAVWFVDPATR